MGKHAHVPPAPQLFRDPDALRLVGIAQRQRYGHRRREVSPEEYWQARRDRRGHHRVKFQVIQQNRVDADYHYRLSVQFVYLDLDAAIVATAAGVNGKGRADQAVLPHPIPPFQDQGSRRGGNGRGT